MSKPRLIQAIQCKKSNKIPLKVSPVLTITEGMESTDVFWNYGYEYRIELVLGSTRVISEEVAKRHPGAIDQAIYETQRAIVEEVYGDIRKKLFELQIRLHNESHVYSQGTESIKMVEELIDMVTM